MVALVLNYLVIQAAIVAFIAPFYAWYLLHCRRRSIESLPFNHHVEQFFSGREANWLVFAWALGEALVWFVIPEFLLLLMVFMRVRNKRQMVIWDIYGTAAGVLLAYLLNLSRAAVSHLPYITEKMVDQVDRWYGDMGIWGLLYQPFSGVPFKAFTHTAEAHGFNLLLFLIVAVVIRISRYVVAYGVFVAMYPVLHKYVRRNYVPLFLIGTFIFSLLLYRVVRVYA